MVYLVKSGDTLSKIASKNGLTLAQLIEANPGFKTNPNSMKVGDAINIPDAFSTADTQPFPVSSVSEGTAAVAIAVEDSLGTLSAKYETGGRGPGTVSTGLGDHGGVSYGSYQMATNTGTVKRFVSQPDFPWRRQFESLSPGTPEFTARWKDIARGEPIAFQACQHAFIKKTHYDLLVSKIRADDDLDVTSRSKALQDVIWSTSVQHGGATPVVHRALTSLNMRVTAAGFDRKLICAIYAERGRKDLEGNLVYFSKSRHDVQAGVANRFKNEEADALRMLGEEERRG